MRRRQRITRIISANMWTARATFALCSLLVALVQPVPAQNPLPSYIKVCRRSDPNIEECIKNSVENLRPQLRNGIPELDVPGLEPLNINEINVTPGNTRVPRFKAVGHNVLAHGVGDFIIHKIEADLDKNTFRCSIGIPLIKFEGEYEVNINFLAFPIKGRGPLTGNTTDAYGEAILAGHFEERDGNKYIQFKNIDVDIALSNYQIHLGNLFGSDKVLGDSINQAINANSKDFIKVIKPIVDATASDILTKAANRISGHFTYDQLFPQ